MKLLNFITAATFLVACKGDDQVPTQPDAPKKQPDAAIDAPPDAPNGKLAINEVQADGTPDTVELYNGTNATIDLSTYYLADSGLAPVALTGTIAAGGYKVLSQAATGGDFTFGLSKTADAVNLYSDNGVTMIDSVTWTQNYWTDTVNNVAGAFAYGRYPNGTGDFAKMAPSPNAANTAPL